MFQRVHTTKQFPAQRHFTEVRAPRRAAAAKPPGPGRRRRRRAVAADAVGAAAVRHVRAEDGRRREVVAILFGEVEVGHNIDIQYMYIYIYMHIIAYTYR